MTAGSKDGSVYVPSHVRHGLAYYCSSVGPLYNRLFAHWKLSEGRNSERRAGVGDYEVTLFRGWWAFGDLLTRYYYVSRTEVVANCAR
jgi:hypothetical protein